MTCPRFRAVASRLNELIAAQARDGVFLGVAAAIGNNKTRDFLFDASGDFFLGDGQPVHEYTQEELETAQRRLDAILAARQEADSSKND